MILAIRSDKPEAELYLVDNKKIVKELKWPAHRELADTLLGQISGLVESAGINLKSIEGLIVFTGEGSFTGLRIGTTVANALAYGLTIPIVSAESGNWIMHGLEKLENQQSGKYVVPKYSSEPNITKSKKASA